MDEVALALDVLGWVENDAMLVEDVPSQGLPSRVRLRDHFQEALEGVEPGDHMYVIAQFHKADGTVLRASPGTRHQQGAFSIRGSCRPNRLGMTLSKVVSVDGPVVEFEWLDFSNGSPVVDLKRYNWRWEVVPSARRLDRRHIEGQIPRRTLELVLQRPAANFHGENCEAVERVASLAALLIHDHGVWLGSPNLNWTVLADGHYVDALQGLTGATLGSGRLSIDLTRTLDPAVITVVGDGIHYLCAPRGETWSVASLTS